MQVATEGFVVRGSLSSPPALMASTGPTLVSGVFGFSVQYAPGVPIEALTAEIPNVRRYMFVAIANVKRLRPFGAVVLWPTPGAGAYHATVRTDYPLESRQANLISIMFEWRRNPLYAP